MKAKTKVETLAVVVPHRDPNGVWTCRRWRFVCLPCGAFSDCYFHTPSTAGDWARRHLSDIHLVKEVQP